MELTNYNTGDIAFVSNKAKLAVLRHSKYKDSTLQANTNDSLRQVIYERRNKL